MGLNVIAYALQAVEQAMPRGKGKQSHRQRKDISLAMNNQIASSGKKVFLFLICNDLSCDPPRQLKVLYKVKKPLFRA